MAKVFDGNEYPQVMYKADQDPIYVTTKEKRQEALEDGWSDQYQERAWPKLVKAADGRKVKNPHGVSTPDNELPPIAVKKLCHNPSEEKAWLAETAPKGKQKELATV